MTTTCNYIRGFIFPKYISIIQLSIILKLNQSHTLLEHSCKKFLFIKLLTIIKEIEQNPLTWYSHVQQMAEGRLPKIALKWMPKQRRVRGRLKKNWMEGIKKAMHKRNLNEGQWEDRKQWSLGVGQCRKTF